MGYVSQWLLYQGQRMQRDYKNNVLELILCCYNHLDKPLFPELISVVCNLIHTSKVSCPSPIYEKTQFHTWLTGDFNLPNIIWENGSVKDRSQYRKHHQDFLDFLVNASLSQMVQTPTRGENTLDLFATNNDTLVTRCDTILGMSDHDCVLVESRLRPKKFRVRRGTFPVWK